MAPTALHVAVILAVLGAAAQSLKPPLPPTPQPPATASRYSLIFFGDSLTDIGNDFKAAGVPDRRLYSNGRFTNGLVWADYLRQTVQRRASAQALNYAYGGATACASPGIEELYPFVKNLTGQVAAFAADVEAKRVRLANTRPLALQYIGTDDLMLFVQGLVASNATATPEDIEALVTRVVACRVEGAAALAAVPGVTDIAIVPLAPLYTYPAVPAAFKEQMLNATLLATNRTAVAMAALNVQLAAAGSAAKVHVLGNTTWLASGLNKIIPQFGYMDEPCLRLPGSYLDRNATADVKPCRAPVNFYMYDQFNPSTRFHDWLGSKAVLLRLQTLGLLP